MRRPLAAALCSCVALFVCLRVAPASADALTVNVLEPSPAITPTPAPAITPALAPVAAPSPSTPAITPIPSTTAAPLPALPSAHATARPPSGPHSGVMWRVLLGGAYMHGWSSADGVSRTVSAVPALAVSVSMGHAISTDLVLHMDVSYARSGAATYSSEGKTLVDSVSLTSVLLGVGVTYWFNEYDLFVTGGVGLAQISTVSGAFRLGSVEIPNIESTDLGFGAHAGVGKQWGLGKKWGIGPAFDLSFMGAPQSVGAASPLKLLAATLSICATYD